MSTSSSLGGMLEVLEDRSERQYKKHDKNITKKHDSRQKHDQKQFFGIRDNLVIFAIRLSPLVRAPRILLKTS